MRSKSLRGQLTRAAMLTMLLATLLITGAVLAYEFLNFRNAWAEDLRTQADLVSRATAAALVFNDPKVAQENLALLQGRPAISAAAIYARDGPPVATYLRAPDEALPARPPAATKPGQAHFDGPHIEMAYPIEHDGEQVGTLYLRAEHEIWSRLVGYAIILGAIAAGSLAFAYYVFDRLQVRVTTPLAKMTDVAQQVIASRDWSLRAPDTEYHDFRVLVEAFNGMLTECGNHTSELERQMAIREKAEHDLRLADRRKDEFLATLAHELRNPLAPMTTAVSLIEAPEAPAETRSKAVAILGRQVRHMVRLIDDLLDASRIATGKLSLVRRPVDLAALLRSAVELAQPFVTERGLSLSLSLPPQPLPVDGDAVRLAQVFSNLLNNACRYNRPGGAVDIVARQDGTTIEVSVHDTGIGVPPELQEQIFELFEQADKSFERGSAGLGIGLTLARQLVQLHGGSIVMTSEGLGKGSCFTVRLPRLVPVSDAVLAEQTESAPPAPRSLHVLVADDNVDLADSLADILRAEGHHVDVANDGEGALQAAAAQVPDVALLDIGMPRRNGYEVARLLRANRDTRGIYLVAITGWGQPSDKAQADEAGFDRYLVKPVEPNELLTLLASVAAALERPLRTST